MLIPVRCFTCGKVIGNLENSIKKLQNEGFTDEQVMDKLKIKMICCRRVLLSYIDLSEELFMYQETPDKVQLYDGVKDVRIYKGL